MGKIIGDALFWAEWHFIVGQVIVFLLLARVVLFFQQGNSHYSRYKLVKKDWPVIKATLKFYFSLGRSLLPAWFAINPVWRILYALFYIVLIVMLLSGFAPENALLLGIYWPSVHQSLALVVNVWLVLHVLAVFIHDWKSRVNRVSAMINGVVYFEVDSARPSIPPQENVIQTSFDLSRKK